MKRDKPTSPASLRGAPRRSNPKAEIASAPEGAAARNDSGAALPPGWVWTTLESVAAGSKNAIVDGPFGSNLKVSDYIDDANGVPVLTTKNLAHGYSKEYLRFISRQKFEQLRRSEVRGGDILVAKIGSCGKTGIYPSTMPSAMIPANLLKMTVHPVLEKLYIFYFLNSSIFQDELKEIITATAQPAFNVSKFRNLPLPLAPLLEQRRIVAKIEELLTDLDASIAALKRVKANLKRYKATVLKAACEGRLVSQDPNDEPASKLLERILAERRAKWEADLRAKGKDPKKVKYVEPTPPGTSDLPELPEGWVWVTVETVCHMVPGYAFSSDDFIDEGIPVIKIANIGYGEFLWEQQEYLAPQFIQKCSEYQVLPGTVLLALTRPITIEF